MRACVCVCVCVCVERGCGGSTHFGRRCRSRPSKKTPSSRSGTGKKIGNIWPRPASQVALATGCAHCISPVEPPDCSAEFCVRVSLAEFWNIRRVRPLFVQPVLGPGRWVGPVCVLGTKMAVDVHCFYSAEWEQSLCERRQPPAPPWPPPLIVDTAAEAPAAGGCPPVQRIRQKQKKKKTPVHFTAANGVHNERSFGRSL